MIRAILGTVSFAIGILFMSFYGAAAARVYEVQLASAQEEPGLLEKFFGIFGALVKAGADQPQLFVAFAVGLVAFVFASIMIRTPAGMLSRRLAGGGRRRGDD